MRIALLTQVVPNPPDAGPRVKTHYLLRTLASEHEVHLITFVRDERELAAAMDLSNLCASITTVPLERKRYLEPLYLLRGWTRLAPFLVARDYRRDFAEVVEQVLVANNIDVLHADQLSMAQYLNIADRHGVGRVFDAHNAVWELVRSMAGGQPTVAHQAAAKVEWRLLRRFEQRTVAGADATLVVAEQDGRALEPGGPSGKAHLVPIGVEVRDQLTVSGRQDATRLLSVATMHYPPNYEAIRWFRDAIWPAIVTGNSKSEVDIVGSRPPDDLKDWAASDDRIHVHGYVENLDDLYESAAVFIVPLKAGSGTRVKILEAMARGVCVVSTTVGVGELDVQHGEHLLIADSAQEFAGAVQTLLEDPLLRAALASAARQRVLERYDWRVCCSPALDVYRGLSRASRLSSAAGEERIFEAHPAGGAQVVTYRERHGNLD